MVNILICGGGGIGSYYVEGVDNLDANGQFENALFTVADDDQVELKNIKYQNFKEEDITDYKAESLSARFCVEAITERIETEEELLKWDCIISAVDNKKFRELLFRTADKHPNKFYWIDLRSEGRSIAYFTKHKKNTLDVMLATLPGDGDPEGGGSCQRKYEFDNNIIQRGNKIIAAMAEQLTLNWYRGDINAPNYIQNI